MDSNWAADNLQVIRTLMERSALYRRALAPIMLFSGVLGVAGGAIGFFLGVDGPKSFILLWASVGLGALAISFLLARKQAMKDNEPFWSAPTRHVARALTPPLFAGAVAGLLVFLGGHLTPGEARWAPSILPAAWMVLYGCSLTAASFFMRRGIGVLGWIFVLVGTTCLGLQFTGTVFTTPLAGNLLMGTTFGLFHVACGVYLYFTENTRDVA